MNFEEVEELLYTDGEVRQRMEEHRRLPSLATDATQNSGLTLIEQSSAYTRTTTLPTGIGRHFGSCNLYESTYGSGVG